MPNYDGGHYFYTGFFPVRKEPVRRPADGSITVPSHLLRETLATLPNFSQVPGSRRASPFARCHATHLARFFVMDDPEYNGRDPGDPIVQSVKKVDLLVHQPVDHLSRAWLVFAADFDASQAGEGPRDRWAEGLWARMEAELRQVFGHCYGFDEVSDAPGFARFIRRGQVETTMSFNDYYVDPLNLPSLSMGTLLLTIAAVTALFAALSWLANRSLHLGWPLYVAAVLLGLACGIYAAYRLIGSRGAKPFPAAPDTTLPAVLKGLYLKQRFTDFAIETQGAAPEDLHRAFAQFAAEVRPDALDGPTLAPGVLQA
jgi:hypothetical protein